MSGADQRIQRLDGNLPKQLCTNENTVRLFEKYEKVMSKTSLDEDVIREEDEGEDEEEEKSPSPSKREGMIMRIQSEGVNLRSSKQKSRWSKVRDSLHRAATLKEQA